MIRDEPDLFSALPNTAKGHAYICVDIHPTPPDPILAQSQVLEFVRSGVSTSLVWSILGKIDILSILPSSNYAYPAHIL